MKSGKSKTPDIKCVIIGDPFVGKTALLYKYATNAYYTKPDTYLDSYEVTVAVKNKELIIGIFDTAGQHRLRVLRHLAFPGTNVFIVCFSIEKRDSFKNVKRWIEEIRSSAPGTPFILVGTKKDLRKKEDVELEGNETAEEKPYISFCEGQELAEEVNAEDYIETSIHTMEGIKDVFDQVIMIANERRRRKGPRRKCALL